MISQKTLFLNYLAQTSKSPLLLEIEKAEDCTLYGKEKNYIDLISGISVSSLGHGNKKVIQAIKDQADKYLHLMVYGEIVINPQVELANKLSQVLPFGEKSSIYYVNSGSEAIEGAVKLAKRHTGRTELIGLYDSYHGSTHAPMSISADEYYTDFYRPFLPNTKRIRQNNIEDLNQITNSTAAVFVETVMGEAGNVLPNIEWIKLLRQKCDETGSLLVLDEVQCGMGRTGTLFAFEQYGIEPDILVLAKAFGAGMPLGAFISKKEIMDCLSDNPILGHISTFGGHPVSCAAALAGLNEIIDNKLWENAKTIEYLFREHLTHNKLRSIHGIGAMLSVEFDNQEICFDFVAECIKNGILVDWFLYAPNRMRIAPPLIITEDEIIKVCNIMNKIANEKF